MTNLGMNQTPCVMRNLLVALLEISLIVIGYPIDVPAQPIPSPDPVEARHIIQSWLECDSCDEKELEPVIKLGGKAVGSLKTALIEGPPDGDLALLRSNLRATYQKVKKRADAAGKPSPTQTEEAFVNTYENNYVSLYRIRAATALGAIGGEQARQALDEANKQRYRKDVDRSISAALSKLQ